MRIISMNLNGIRSAARKGFFTWMLEQAPDVVCVQETKAHMAELTDPVLRPLGYQSYFVDAQKKGYSGVGIYCRAKPNAVVTELGWPLADAEGRYIQVDFAELSVASLYLPSGTSGEHRQAEKFRFMAVLAERLQAMRQSGRPMVICGDWNIAHRQIDLKNWRGNQKNSGFLPEERAWLDQVFGDWGWVDAFRHYRPVKEQYTWWSFRGQARAKNVGWRIDYQVVTPQLAEAIVAASVYTDTLFSDHAPLMIDYALQ